MHIKNLLNTCSEQTFEEAWYINRGFSGSDPRELYPVVKEFIAAVASKEKDYWKNREVSFFNGNINIVDADGDVPYVILEVFARALSLPEISYVEKRDTLRGLMTILQPRYRDAKHDICTAYAEPTLPVRLVEGDASEIAEIPFSFWLYLPFLRKYYTAEYKEELWNSTESVQFSPPGGIDNFFHFLWFTQHRRHDVHLLSGQEYKVKIVADFVKQGALNMYSNCTHSINPQDGSATVTTPPGMPMYLIRSFLPYGEQFDDILADPLAILRLVDYLVGNMTDDCISQCVQECLAKIKQEITKEPLSLEEIDGWLGSVSQDFAHRMSAILFRSYISSASRAGTPIQEIAERFSELVEKHSLAPNGNIPVLDLCDLGLNKDDAHYIRSLHFVCGVKMANYE